MIEKIGKFVDGKVAAGLIAASSLGSAGGAIANTSNQSKEEISKVLVVDQEGNNNQAGCFCYCNGKTWTPMTPSNRCAQDCKN